MKALWLAVGGLVLSLGVQGCATGLAQPFEPINESRRAFDDERAVSDVGERLAYGATIRRVVPDQKNAHHFRAHWRPLDSRVRRAAKHGS